MPLVHLRSPKLLKVLREAGSRIYCTPEQADALAAIAPLLVVSETEKPTVEIAKTYEGLDNLLEQLSSKDDTATGKKDGEEQAAKTKAAAIDENLLHELDEEEQDAEEEDKPLKIAKEDKATIQLLGKFVDLTDLLPPLPHKGSFKVEAIKDSQYFFS